MEAKPDGFSIREYTLKMRSVNVFKCWPFPIDDLTREEVESRLPPMTIPNPRGGYETKHQHGEVFERNNQRESVKSASLFSRVGTMEAPPMKEEQRHIQRLKSKASRRRTLTDIFNLDMVGEEKLSSMVIPSEKQASPSPLVPPPLLSLLLPEQLCQSEIKNNLEVLALDVDQCDNENKSKINCGLQAQGSAEDLAKLATTCSGHGDLKASIEFFPDEDVSNCAEQSHTEEQQPMMSPSLKQVHVVCDNKLNMEEDEVNEEEFQKSNCIKNKINMKNKVANKRMRKITIKVGKRWVPPLNYKRKKNNVLNTNFTTTKSHSIKKSEELKKSSCSNISKIKSKRSVRKDMRRKDGEEIIMNVGKHWVVPLNSKMTKKYTI